MSSTSPPEGYAIVRRGADRILVREEFREVLDRIDLADLDALRSMAEGPRPDRAFIGRGRHFTVELPGGVRAVVKESRRGGMRAWVFPDLYFGGGRFLREVRVTGEAERRGIRVAPIIASITRPAGLGFCRHHYIIRELEGTVDLGEYLGGDARPVGGGYRERRDVVRGVAEGVRSLHDAGLCHGDLNLGNILIARREDAPVEVGFIDLDTTRSSGEAPHGRRARNLLRLYRSLLKSDLPEGAVPRTDLLRFTISYSRGDRPSSRRWWRRFRRGRLLLRLHQILWGLGLRQGSLRNPQSSTII
jgi:3-deoxy-D-manno-octulosonic acid kinase